jgi:DNA-binding NarL/FixJ family response regulator
MTRVLLINQQPDERAALRLLLLDLTMEVAGEAADWPTAMALAPFAEADILLVDWELVSKESGNTLIELREACPGAVVIVLISQLDARRQAALSAGADAFISKGEMPERVAARLRAAAAAVRYP